MSVKILVVDDEPDLELLIRQKFRRQIRAGTFAFAFARNGVEALQVLSTDRDIPTPRQQGVDESEASSAAPHWSWARLERAVGRLVAADIVHELSLPPRVTYVFKHALIQDVAYATLPDDRRRTLHAQIAQWLVARQPETVATQPELVAQHYTEAERTEQALPYWLQAGQQALQHSANPEAVQHLTRRLALLARLPETSAWVQPGRIRHVPEAPRAGDCPHQPKDAVGPGAPPW